MKKTTLELTANKFEAQKLNDLIKKDYCVENNINLIRIPYTQLDSVEEILKDEILVDYFTDEAPDKED